MRKFVLMAIATTVLAANAANPFFDYKNWKTPHGAYPFNEIHAEHYMPAFEEGMKQGLKRLMPSSTTPKNRHSKTQSKHMSVRVSCSV